MKLFLFIITLCAFTFALEIDTHFINQKFDAAQGLYTIPNDTLQLGRVDPVTGKITPYGPVYSHLQVSEHLSVLDYINEIYYAVTLDKTNNINVVHLTGLDLETGAIASQTKLPLVQHVFLGAGQGIDFDPATGDVFVFGQDMQFGPHKLMRISPTKGTINNITEFDNVSVLGGVSAYDPLYKIFWVEVPSNYSLSLVGIDVTKNGTDAIAFTLSDEFDIETLVFDPSSKQMYGLAIVDKKYRTTIVLSSKTGKIREITKIENYSVLYSGECGLDWKNRILYAILQPEGPNDKIPFHLVGIALKGGEVMTKPEFCQESCPWGLEYYNKQIQII